MIEIRQSKVFRGPSIWARVPVVHLTIDIGDLEERPSNAIPGLTERLLELIPTLHDHKCSRGHRGGFVENLREGTAISHVLEHVAIELQSLTGADVSRGKTRDTAERGVYNVIYQYRQEEVGVAAGALGCRLLNHLVHSSEPELGFALEMENLVRLAERMAYGPSTAAIVEAAERNGIPVLRLYPRRSLVQLGHGCYQQRIWATVTSKSSSIGESIAGDKSLTNGLLQDAGLPSPRGAMARNVEDAVAVAGRIGFPVVLKPLDGNHGRGVCLGLRSEAEVRACYPTASEASRDGTVLVERYITGKDYRILVIDQRVVAVA